MTSTNDAARRVPIRKLFIAFIVIRSCSNLAQPPMNATPPSAANYQVA